MIYPLLADQLFGTPPLSLLYSPRFWPLSKTLISLRWEPLRRPSAPLQFKDPSDEGRLTDELAFHVGKSDHEICPRTARLVHTGVKGDWRPDTRAEHTGNADTTLDTDAGVVVEMDGSSRLGAATSAAPRAA